MDRQPYLAEDAFARLVRREEARLRAYLARRVPADAVDDVLADILLVAWRRRDEIPIEPLPWLGGSRRRPSPSDDEARRDATHSSSSSRASRRRQRLASKPKFAVARGNARSPRLSGPSTSRDRELLLLRFWDDLRPREIAAAWGCRQSPCGRAYAERPSACTGT
jgi:RNA polymerase sigma-70 factor (ECF subfamily)